MSSLRERLETRNAMIRGYVHESTRGKVGDWRGEGVGIRTARYKMCYTSSMKNELSVLMIYPVETATTVR